MRYALLTLRVLREEKERCKELNAMYFRSADWLEMNVRSHFAHFCQKIR